MKLTSLLAAFVALSGVGLSGAAHAAPARSSTAIAATGDYVYVVENGVVYKLSARDLKPIARTSLPSRTPAARSRRAAKNVRRNSRRRVAHRMSNSNRRASGRARATHKARATRRARTPRMPIDDAPLPPPM